MCCLLAPLGFVLSPSSEVPYLTVGERLSEVGVDNLSDNDGMDGWSSGFMAPLCR